MKIKRTLPSILQNVELQSFNQMSTRKLFSKKSVQSPQKSHIQIIKDGHTHHNNQIQNIYGRRKRIFSEQRLEKRASVKPSSTKKDNQLARNSYNKQFFILNAKNERMAIQKANSQNKNRQSFLKINVEDTRKKRVSFSEYRDDQNKSISKRTQQYLTSQYIKGKTVNQIQAEQMIQKINQLQQNLRKIQQNMQSKASNGGYKSQVENRFEPNRTDRSIVDQLFKNSRRTSQDFQDLVKQYQENSNMKDAKLKVLQLQLERMSRCQRLARQNELLFQQLKESLFQEDRILEESFVGISRQNSYHFGTSQKKSRPPRNSDMLWPSHDKINENQFFAQEVEKQRFQQTLNKQVSRSPKKHHIFSPINLNNRRFMETQRRAYQPSSFNNNDTFNQKQTYERSLSPLQFAKINQLEKQASPHFVFNNIQNLQQQLASKTVQIARNPVRNSLQSNIHIRPNKFESPEKSLIWFKYKNSQENKQGRLQ